MDLEQVSVSLVKTNYLPALESKAWSKRTFTLVNVRGAILNVFLICSSVDLDDILNKAYLNCFLHIIHCFLSYAGTIERLTIRLGGEQHSSITVESEIRLLILDSILYCSEYGNNTVVLTRLFSSLLLSFQVYQNVPDQLICCQ